MNLILSNAIVAPNRKFNSSIVHVRCTRTQNFAAHAMPCHEFGQTYNPK